MDLCVEHESQLEYNIIEEQNEKKKKELGEESYPFSTALSVRSV